MFAAFHVLFIFGVPTFQDKDLIHLIYYNLVVRLSDQLGISYEGTCKILEAVVISCLTCFSSVAIPDQLIFDSHSVNSHNCGYLKCCIVNLRGWGTWMLDQ